MLFAKEFTGYRINQLCKSSEKLSRNHLCIKDSSNKWFPNCVRKIYKGLFKASMFQDFIIHIFITATVLQNMEYYIFEAYASGCWVYFELNYMYKYFCCKKRKYLIIFRNLISGSISRKLF